MSLLAACPDDGKTGPLPAAEAPAGGAVPAAPSTDAAPLVDPAALQDLGEQLNSAAVAKGFARDYAQMWDQRYDALATALDRRDQAAELAAELEEVIRSGSLAQAASRLGDVAARGSETVDELQFSYILWER